MIKTAVPFSLVGLPGARITEEEVPVADGEMTYHNGYHYVRDNGNDDHDEVLLGQHLATVGSAGRDVDDAGRDLTSAVADANRDLISAGDDATRDLINAHNDSSAHAQILAAIGASTGRVADLVNANGRDILRESAAVREEVAQQGKENIVGILDQGSRGREVTFDQGSRGRETTLATSAQIREDLADAKADLMKEHCETQKLVITEHCKTREQLAAEAVRTRELISAEARATVEREMTSLREANSLLQLQLNLLSAPATPLAAR